jgi:cytochrome b561
MRRLHWAIAWFIVFALVLIEIKGWFPRGSAARTAVKWGHMQFGIAVLLLMVPRLLVRLRHAAPPITPESPRWQAVLGRLVHLALYLLVFAVPLLGVSMMFVAGKPWNLFGLPLPVLATPDADLAHAIEGIHRAAGNVLMWLAIAHVAAALFHHFVQHDDTLLRMLPARRNRFR